MQYALWIMLAYVLGSVPFGLLVAKKLCGQDPREAGSRNTGATNVARVCGFKFGLLSLFLDILKGFLPVYVAGYIGTHWVFLSLTAFAAVCGHVFSIFLGFKGGKAVATTIGIFLALVPWQILIAVAVCILVIKISGYVSLGSLALVTAMPILSLAFWTPLLLPLDLAVMALVYWRHRENITRLAKGEENSWRKKN